MKDTLERTREPNLNLKGYLQNAYIHPLFKCDDEDDNDAGSMEMDKNTVLVPTKRQSRLNTPLPSKYSDSASPFLPEAVQESSYSVK